MIERDGDLLGYFSDSDYFLDHQGATVQGLFSEKYQSSDGFSGSRPAFQCRESDVKSLAQGDQIAIRKYSDINFTALYRAQQFEPDGHGMTVLMLEQQ